MNNSFEPWHMQANAAIKSQCGRKAVASGGAVLLAALLLAVPRIGSAQDFVPLPVVNWPMETNTCVGPNSSGIVMPDATVAPYVLQLANYLETLVAQGQLAQADAFAELAATAEYFNLPAAQLDRVLTATNFRTNLAANVWRRETGTICLKSRCWGDPWHALAGQAW